MITEDYVSFEIAKLLKEKGFDVYGDGSFNSGIEVFAEYSPSGTFNKCITNKPHQKAYPAPTLQMAMKWLRKEHNIVCNINIESRNFYYYNVFIIRSSIEAQYQFTSQKPYFESPEQACEAALKYCLENLI